MQFQPTVVTKLPKPEWTHHSITPLQQKHLQNQTNCLNYHYNGQILMNQILVETLCIASIHITLLNFSHNKPQTTHFPPFSKNFEMQQKEGHRTTPGVQLNPKNSLPCYTEQHMFHATQSSTCSMLHRAAHVSNCQFDTINTNPVWVKLSWKGNWLNDNSPSLCKKRRKATWIEDYPWLLKSPVPWKILRPQRIK